jgi:hypothetical protein
MRLLLSLGLIAVVGVLFPLAKSSADTVTSPTFDPVVRVQGANPSTGGTGTLIATRQVGDAYGMIFLAADHTLERIGPLNTIGFGAIGTPNLNLSPSGALNFATYTKGPDGTEDLALIGLTINLATLSAAQSSYLTGVAPITVTPSPQPFSPFEITDFGYGKSGPITTYGTQQTFNNVINAYLSFSGSYTTDIHGNPLIYTQAMEQWTYNNPGTGDWVPGEGAGYGGFSGSPLLVMVGGTPEVQGIQSSGSDVVDGATSIGVSFTQGYVDWIQAESSAYLATVPEPSTALLLSAGIVGLAVRRHGARTL